MADGAVVRRVACRRYWRESDARVVVEDWRRSGQSLRSYCKQHGLSRQRVARWAGRIAASPVRFHPVELVAASDDSSGGRVIEVELGGGETVRLPGGFAVEDLRHVLQVLAERRGC